MSVPVMGIGCVRVTVLERLVPMPVGMRFARRIAGSVVVLMVLVVVMCVVMSHRWMQMKILMAFGDMEPNTEPHQCGGSHELRRHRLTKDRDSGRSAEEGHRRKVGPGTCRAQMPHRQHEQGQTDAVSGHPYDAGDGYRSCARQAAAQSEPEEDVKRSGN